MGGRAYNYNELVRYIIERYQYKDGFKEGMSLLNAEVNVPEDIKNPANYKNGFDYSFTMGVFREPYNTKYGFVLVTKRMAREIAKVIGTDKALEVMSGTGYLAMALQQEGANVIPTDDFSWEENVFHTVKPWTEIEKLDCTLALKKYMLDPEVQWLLLSWPPYNKPIAAELLTLLMEINADVRPDNPINLIYIGEDCGGCTADDDFFDIIYDENFWEPDNEFTDAAMYGPDDDEDGWFRQFNGLHDWPYVYRWVGKGRKAESNV